MHRARYKTIHLSDNTCTYICSRVLLEMCRFGKHAICIDACVGYKLLNNIQLIVGIAGIVLLSIGLRLVSSVDVVVGRMPVAWVLGMLTAIVGSSCLLLCTTLFVAACMSRHEKDEKAEEVHRNRLLQFVVPFLAATLLLSSGLFNVLYHPRQAVICPCPDNFYGIENGTVLSTCLPCNCGRGTCSSGRDGNGDCLCPDRYDPESQCQECIPGAEEQTASAANLAWDYNHASGSCAGCVSRLRGAVRLYLSWREPARVCFGMGDAVYSRTYQFLPLVRGGSELSERCLSRQFSSKLYAGVR